MNLALAYSEAQALLFDPKPSRLGLSRLHLPADPAAPGKRIHVWRNHAFEPLIELMQPYLAFGRWQAQFSLSDYDDSLSFGEELPEADLHLLWLDTSRVQMPLAEWTDWLLGRLAVLRARSSSPVLIVTWLDAALFEPLRARLPTGMHAANLQAACDDAGCALLDARNATWAGSPLSRQAQLLAARALACHWLPGLLLPPLKAIALDLDHTLYRGVLGEDGAQGLDLTPGHRDLQEHLLALREQGVFLALVSRNEPADVQALFGQRPDFPLQWQHFSATDIGWGDKSGALERIAVQLRIGLDAVLFVDDNPGELAQVSLHHPQIRSAWAHPDAALTLRVMQQYPGLWRWTRSVEDGLRLQDARMHAERAALVESDPSEYFHSLQVSLTFGLDSPVDLPRLADLCVKTNQFNLALRRSTPAQLQALMDDPLACVVGVRLADRLSDSGIVAVVVAQVVNEQLLVRELCISCRALGRRLEDSIVALALQQMPLLAQCDTVAFDLAEGPRNQPARDWLARWQGPGLAQRLREFQAPEGVRLLHP